jgi:hypothetical protein
MTRFERMIAPGGFGLAAMLFFFAAVSPAFSGGSLNAAFLGAGVVFLAVGVAMWRKARGKPGEPDR